MHLYYEEPIVHGHLLTQSIFIEENYEVKIGDVRQRLNIENLDL